MNSFDGTDFLQVLKPLLYTDFISQLQRQKLINSWAVEQREQVTCAAVHNPIDANFLVAVNKTVGRKQFDDDDDDNSNNNNNNLYFKGVTPITMKYSRQWPSKNKIDNNKLQQSR